MNIGTDIILVTGATGQQGGVTARALLANGHAVRAMTRKPDSDAAQALAEIGATIVPGELDDGASLEAAMDGVWGVFGVQNTWEAGVEKEEVQGKRLVDAAKAAGIRHYVYTSVGSAHLRTGIPHFDNKSRVEDHLRAAGIPSFTIIRPVFFMENLLSPWFKPAIDEGTLAVGIAPTTSLQMIAVKDIGEYARIVFERHAELNGRAIDLAGDELTMPAAAEIISTHAGRTVTHFQVPIEDVRSFSADFAAMLEWFDAVGYSAPIAQNAEEFGVRPTTFAEWASGANWN